MLLKSNHCSKVDPEQQQESVKLDVSCLKSSNLERTEVSPEKGRVKSRPADLLIQQQTSSLQSLEMEEVSGWSRPCSQTQAGDDFVVLARPQVYSMVSPPLYNVAPGFQLMSPVTPPIALVPQPFHSLSSALLSPQSPQGEDLFATVLSPGYVRLVLGSGVLLDISNDLSLRVSNPRMDSSIAVCGQTQRAAIIHPRGRALLYKPRLEVQVEDQVSVKTAKLFPPGRMSFTANNCALVYALDKGGLRSTTDVFHDLHADNIVDTMFQETCLAQHSSVDVSRTQMHESQFWRTQVSLPLPSNL